MSSECADEQVTQHHSKGGYGLVKDEETLILALFDIGGAARTEITIEDFPVKSLQSNDLSLARLTYTSREIFDKFVVGEGAKGEVTNVAYATAAAIRGMPDYVVQGVHPKKTGRAICVLDKVESDDHDGHAALGFSESQQTLSDKQRGAVRRFIRSDLAKVFAKLGALESMMPRPAQGAGTAGS